MFYLFYQLDGKMVGLTDDKTPSPLKPFDHPHEAAEWAEDFLKSSEKFIIVSDESIRTIKGIRLYGSLYWRFTDGKNKPIKERRGNEVRYSLLLV